MKPLEISIADWHRHRYPGVVNVAKTYRKLLEEVGELGQALLNNDPANIFEEAGDVAFVLCHILRGSHLANPSLIDAMEASLRKCEERDKSRAHAE